MGKYIRYSDDFLARVREDADLVSIIGRDITLKKAGKAFKACCPFHEEKTPSFEVSQERNTYKCYGCGAQGDAIEWMIEHHNLPFLEAVAAVAADAGIPMPSTATEETAESIANRKQLVALSKALQDACRLYVSGIERSPIGSQYLTFDRGLSPGTVTTYQLGTVATGIVEWLLKRHDAENLIACGLAIRAEDGRLFDRFRNRLMIPIYNEASALIGFAGRSFIEKPDRTPKYLNSPETVLFHKGNELYAMNLAKPTIRSARHAVVVEGYFDVLTAHQAGDLRVVAPMGTALTNAQARRLFTHADTVTFAFDGDKAGRSAALRASAVVLEEMKDGKTAQFLFLPEGSDPDQLIRNQGINVWNQMLESASPLSRFLSDYVKHGLDMDVAESQVRAAEKARKILTRVGKASLYKQALTAQFERTIGMPLLA
jgi:DNA primase